MTSDLLPCPFCRGTKGRPILDEIAEDHGGGWRVGCYGCGIFIAIPRTRDDAIAAWNTRPAPSLPEIVAEDLMRLAEAWKNAEVAYVKFEVNGLKEAKTAKAAFAAKIKELRG